MSPVGIVFILLQIFLIIAHALIVKVINNGDMTDNRYFLIQILSTTDIVYAITNIPIVFILNAGPITELDAGTKCLLILANTAQQAGLYTTFLISLDRLVAVHRCLEYHLLVTRRRILFALCGMLPPSVLTNTLLVFLTERKTRVLATYGIVILNFSWRLTTCIAILFTGSIALLLRKINLRLHDREPARLDMLTSLKRSIKDVAVLNFWTIVFFIPLLITGTTEIFGKTENARSTQIAIAFLQLANSLANPFIYVFTQREICKRMERQLACCVPRSIVDV